MREINFKNIESTFLVLQSIPTISEIMGQRFHKLATCHSLEYSFVIYLFWKWGLSIQQVLSHSFFWLLLHQII